MTKKHFIILAQAIKDAPITKEQRNVVAGFIGQACSKANSNFNWQTWTDYIEG